MNFAPAGACRLLLFLAFLGFSSGMRAQSLNRQGSSEVSKLVEAESSPQLPEVSQSGKMLPLEGKIDRQSYQLGPGDEVDVSVWGTEVYRSRRLTVSAEGRLLVPPAGALEVAGMSLADAEVYLVRELSKYYAAGRISLSLVNPRRFRVYAAGAIPTPGSFVFSAIDRVSDLVRAVGGIKAGGSRRRIRLLTQTGELIAGVDLLRYAASGDPTLNPHLSDGCIVEVPPQENYVVLRGKFANLAGTDSVFINNQNVDETYEYAMEYLPGETLRDILTLAGGPREADSLQDVGIFPAGETRAPCKYIPLSAEILNQGVARGTIYEFPAPDSWVYVTGYVNIPGRLLYRPGWTVRDYLGKAGGPGASGSGRTCLLRRAGLEELKVSSAEPVLPGDVLYVPEKFSYQQILMPFVSGAFTAAIVVIFKK